MGRIPADKIHEIRTSINIAHYISQFVNLKKTGANYKGLCPFHQEKTPSFLVNPEKQIFHCFGCGKGGNIYTFITDYEKMSFIEAVKKAADFAGILLPEYEREGQSSEYIDNLYEINEIACKLFENNLYKTANKQQLNYFFNRNLSESTIKDFRLGYAANSFEQLLQHFRENRIELKNAKLLGLLQQRERDDKFYDKFRHRVIFPFFSAGGKIVGFGGRKLNEDQQPKYLNSPESPIYKKSELLYGLFQANQAIRSQGYAVLVEGYFDLLRLYENDIKNVVASSGTALSDRQAGILRRYTNSVYIAYDGDDAGIKAAVRSAQILEK
ncbi:MAG: DNA primase, partial [Caldithrix sp.]|nr:DNA primase [Caldithrix sp.]